MPLQFVAWEQTVEEGIEVPGYRVPLFESWTEGALDPTALPFVPAVAVPLIVPAIAVPLIVPRLRDLPLDWAGRNLGLGISAASICWCVETCRVLIYQFLDHLSLSRLRAVGDFAHERLIEPPYLEPQNEPEPDPSVPRTFIVVIH
jgi:hypothetical protein